MFTKNLLRLITWSFLPWFLILPGKYAFWVVWQLSKIFGFILVHSPFRKKVAQTMKMIFKREDTDKLAKTLLYKTTRYIYETLNLGRLTAKSAAGITSFSGLEHLDKTMQGGKGGIILVMHAGNWELEVAALARKKYPLHVAIKKKKGDHFIEFIDRNRRKNGQIIINTATENMFRSAFKAIKKGEIFLLAADTGALESDKHIFLDFLSGKVPIATGWATLALKSGASVMVMLDKTNGNDLKHQTEIKTPIDPGKYKTEEKLIKAVLSICEKYVEENPTEWFLALSEYETKKSFGN